MVIDRSELRDVLFSEVAANPTSRMTVIGGNLVLLRLRELAHEGWARRTFDDQSGLIELSRAACERANDAIRTAYDRLSPEAAIETIGVIWEAAERTSRLAEARTRLCLARVGTPTLSGCPLWLSEQLESLSKPEEGLAPSHPQAAEAAALLVRACLYGAAKPVEADIQKAPLGCVSVDWRVPPALLHWEIEASRLPWPGVKVNVLASRHSSGKSKVDHHVFHTAFEVIKHFREQLYDMEHETGVHRRPASAKP